jgi:hypothetical protein
MPTSLKRSYQCFVLFNAAVPWFGDIVSVIVRGHGQRSQFGLVVGTMTRFWSMIDEMATIGNKSNMTSCKYE